MDATVNKAVEELVSERYGGKTWEQVRARAGLNGGQEEGTEAGAVRLLGVTGEVLAIPRMAMLEAFGRHWVLNNVRKSSDSKWNFEGRSLSSFVDEIPEFLEKLSPLKGGVEKGSFLMSERVSDGFRLDLVAQDAEWTPVVVGMLLGVGELFRTNIRITRMTPEKAATGEGTGTESFLVRWTELRRP